MNDTPRPHATGRTEVGTRLEPHRDPGVCYESPDTLSGMVWRVTYRGRDWSPRTPDCERLFDSEVAARRFLARRAKAGADLDRVTIHSAPRVRWREVRA